VLLAIGVMVSVAGCLPGADTNPKAGTGNGDGKGYHHALMTNVRHAIHTEEDGFDRVVFDFLNNVPDWEVSYVERPILADGSGEPVPLAGDFAIKVRMSPASQVLFNPAAPSGIIDLYPGPGRIATGYPQAVEIVETGDFEAVVTWHIGTRAKVPFRVQVLDSPHRLVIDVAHA
jgi:hypothetical protein